MPIIIHQPGIPRVSDQLKPTEVLWRYVNAAKFFDFLENSTLFFTRADRFKDKFEGAFTPSLRRKIEKSYSENRIDYNYEKFKHRIRETVFVNCWHRNRDDSAAMWALYGESDCAVALTTTVGQLSKALLEQETRWDLAIERVEYIRHWRDPKIDIAPYARVFAYKTKAYEHEKEVRVLLDRHDEWDASMPEFGIPINVNAATLLRSIVIAPEAPAWFESLIRASVKRYGLPVPVRKSMLAGDPI